MTPSGLSSEAVVQLGEGDEPAVHRQVVLGVGAFDPETSVHIHDQPGRVAVRHCPVRPNGDAGDQREPRAFSVGAGSSGGQPESRAPGPAPGMAGA